MRIQEAMTRQVHIANPNQSICDAACMMAAADAGVLPVGEGDRLVGMITDRDIAIRAVAQGRGPDTPVRDVMSPAVCYCFEDQEIDEVAANMADVKLRRLPVLIGARRSAGADAASGIFGRFTVGSNGPTRQRQGRGDRAAPLSRAITGVPQAMASIMTSPNGSGQSMGNSRASELPNNAALFVSSISPSNPRVADQAAVQYGRGNSPDRGGQPWRQSSMASSPRARWRLHDRRPSVQKSVPRTTDALGEPD